jgi:hypothetical protein
MAHKIKVVFRRISEPMDPPLFRFTVYSSNGRKTLTSVEFNRLVKAQVAWRNVREAVLKGTVAEEFVP